MTVATAGPGQANAGRASGPVQVEVRLARTHGQTTRCRYLIAEVYNRHYNIVFSASGTDLHGRIEPYPHRYLMALVDGELVAVVGLYIRDTYVQRFGRVAWSDIEAHLATEGVTERYRAASVREPTKLVVRPGWGGYGLGRFLFDASHSRHFLAMETEDPVLVLTCATRSVFQHLHDRVGVRTRALGTFPLYRAHELYRSTDNPMESRLIIPDLDIPGSTWNRRIPGVYTMLDGGEVGDG